MESVEQEETHVELTPRQKYPFLRWLDADDFPAGAFLIFCTIMGGIANCLSGLWFYDTFYLDLTRAPYALLIWVLLGIASGIGVAVAFICWLADNSWE